jgi:preprotein translocase subunit SecD
VLKYGSLPVQLKKQTVQTVSATLGKDSLHAGLVAGLFGTALVLLYMCFYYRVLGLVVIAGMSIWTALNWTIISYLGQHNGLALSLSGVTGLVVSVGVTVDSYVVYFERLKDELRSGRTMRSAVDSAFKHSFRTVLIADTAAFLAAAVLYLLTVGPVRGFAFFLGLSTVLDVVVAYFFKRPLVALLGRWGWLQRSKFVGMHTKVVPERLRPGLGGGTGGT